MKKIILLVLLVISVLLISCQPQIKTPNGSLTDTTWTRPDKVYTTMTVELKFDDKMVQCKLYVPGLGSTGENYLTYVNGSKLYLNKWGKATPTTSSYDSVYSFSMDKTQLVLTHSGGVVITDLAGTYNKK